MERGGQLAGKKSKAPQLSSSPAPSIPALVQATSLDRSEVGQPSENEEVRQADILIACLDREVRCLKKWKKRHLLPSGEVIPAEPPAVILLEDTGQNYERDQGLGFSRAFLRH